MDHGGCQPTWLVSYAMDDSSMTAIACVATGEEIDGRLSR
jgi:hypothetical protein